MLTYSFHKRPRKCAPKFVTKNVQCVKTSDLQSCVSVLKLSMLKIKKKIFPSKQYY